MRTIIRAWNWCKTRWSRLNDWIMRGEPRKSVPLFASPEEAGIYLFSRARYVSDPLWGALDWYVHPERMQSAMERGADAVMRIPGVDCDDFAVWAYAALRQIPGCLPRLLTLGDASGKFGHHVICAFSWERGHGVTDYGAIDTNGVHQFRDLNEATLCAYWTTVYRRCGYRYTEAVLTQYPF